MLQDKANKKQQIFFHIWGTLVLCCFVFLFFNGCAEFITSKDVPGSTLKITVEFADTIEGENYKYGLIYSLTSFNIPEDINQDAPCYTFFPGDEIGELTTISNRRPTDNIVINSDKNKLIAYYYQNYFSAYSDIIKIEPASHLLIKSKSNTFPLTANVDINAEYSGSSYQEDLQQNWIWQSSFLEAENQLVFQIELSKLSNHPIADQDIYFNFFTLNEKNEIIDVYYRNRYDNNIKNTRGRQTTLYDENDAVSGESSYLIINRITARIL